MKLQLDTTNKTVSIESDIKISQLIKTLKSLLPNDWKDFTLKTNVTIQNWSNPIYIEKQIIREREYPQYQPYPITYLATNQGDTCELKSGLFNVETTL